MGDFQDIVQILTGLFILLFSIPVFKFSSYERDSLIVFMLAMIVFALGAINIYAPFY